MDRRSLDGTAARRRGAGRAHDGRR
jgi:hypothetical protein